MQPALLLLASILLGSCAETRTKPQSAILVRIEAELAGKPCIGRLESWHRRYAFRKAANEPADQNEIIVWFTAASPSDPAGRFVDSTIEEWPWDDSPVNMVFARYDVRSGELTLEYCGPNSPAIQQGSPTMNEVAALREAEQGCGLPRETLTFEPNEVGEHDIRINRPQPVSEDRVACSLRRLPPDFAMKFGVGPLVVKGTEQPSH